MKGRCNVESVKCNGNRKSEIRNLKSKTREVRKMKKLIGLGLGLLLVGSLSGVVFAAGDSFTITCTPTGARGVIITTTTVAFGDMAPGAENTTDAIPTQSTGTVANIGYRLSASVASGGIGANLAAADPPSADELLLQANFNSTLPSFVAGDILEAGPSNVVDSGAYGGDYDMANMDLNDMRNLWCKVKFPTPIVTFTQEQTITITVTAEEDTWN